MAIKKMASEKINNNITVSASKASSNENTRLDGITVSEIKAPIATEMAEFELKFKSSMKSSVPLLEKITRYIIKRKGKQMRPMFVFLSAKVDRKSVV